MIKEVREVTILGTRPQAIRKKLGYEPQDHDDYIAILEDSGKDPILYVYPKDVPIYDCGEFNYVVLEKAESIEAVLNRLEADWK